MDAGSDAVEVGERVGGARDNLVWIVCRGSAVFAGSVEFGAELVERDAGLEQFGLQTAQGLVLHRLGAAAQVACGVDGGLGALLH